MTLVQPGLDPASFTPAMLQRLPGLVTDAEVFGHLLIWVADGLERAILDRDVAGFAEDLELVAGFDHTFQLLVWYVPEVLDDLVAGLPEPEPLRVTAEQATARIREINEEIQDESIFGDDILALLQEQYDLSSAFYRKRGGLPAERGRVGPHQWRPSGGDGSAAQARRPDADHLCNLHVSLPSPTFIGGGSGASGALPATSDE